MRLEVDPNPPDVGPSHLTVTLTGADGMPVNGANLEIEGSMTHAGMQPLRAKARAGAGGTYEAPFVWPMAGDWSLTVTASLSDGQVATRQFNLTVAEEMSMGEHSHEHGEEAGKHKHAPGMAMEAAGQGHGDHGHPARVANEGAAIRILSPVDGETFGEKADVRVEIETENFNLGEDGNHWHIYVDGASARMIMGKMTTAVLRDLAPGQHEISAYLSIGTHEELEDGAMVTITVRGQGD